MDCRTSTGGTQPTGQVWRGRGPGDPPADLTSARVFGWCEQHQFDTLLAINNGIVAGRDLEEIAGPDLRRDVGVNHTNGEPAGNAVADVAHRARPRVSEKRFFVHLPDPARLEDGALLVSRGWFCFRVWVRRACVSATEPSPLPRRSVTAPSRTALAPVPPRFQT